MRVRTIHADCLDALTNGQVDPRSVNPAVTSPPYADQRSGNYGGIHPDRYVDRFLPRTQAIQDCITEDGSFALNIKEKAINGEKHPYVMQRILAMRREQGWRLVDEYCWSQKNCYPGKWPNRFRDSGERLPHFTISPKFKMRP